MNLNTPKTKASGGGDDKRRHIQIFTEKKENQNR
jgi:hypothetical protein